MNRFNPETRKLMIIAFIAVVAIIYVVQLFSLQILKPDYKASADSNAFQKRTLYPARGVMYDRNGELLVFNQPAYDLMVVFKETQPFDTADFCRILKIDTDYFKKRQKDIRNRSLNPGYSPYTPQVFMTQLGIEEYMAYFRNLHTSSPASILCTGQSGIINILMQHTYWDISRKPIKKTLQQTIIM